MPLFPAFFPTSRPILLYFLMSKFLLLHFSEKAFPWGFFIIKFPKSFFSLKIPKQSIKMVRKYEVFTFRNSNTIWQVKREACLSVYLFHITMKWKSASWDTFHVQNPWNIRTVVPNRVAAKRCQWCRQISNYCLIYWWFTT